MAVPCASECVGHGCEELTFTACPVTVRRSLQASDKTGASADYGAMSKRLHLSVPGSLPLHHGNRSSGYWLLEGPLGTWKAAWFLGILDCESSRVVPCKYPQETEGRHSCAPLTLRHIPTHIHSDTPTHMYLLIPLVNSVPAPTHTLKYTLTHILSYSFTCTCSHSPTLTLTQVCFLRHDGMFTHHDDKCSSIPIRLTGFLFC